MVSILALNAVERPPASVNAMCSSSNHDTLPTFRNKRSFGRCKSSRTKLSKVPYQISPPAPPAYPSQCFVAVSSVLRPRTTNSFPFTLRTSKSCTGPRFILIGAPPSQSTAQSSSPFGSAVAPLDVKYTRRPSSEKQHARAYEAPMCVNCFIGPPRASTTYISVYPSSAHANATRDPSGETTNRCTAPCACVSRRGGVVSAPLSRLSSPEIVVAYTSSSHTKNNSLPRMTGNL